MDYFDSLDEALREANRVNVAQARELGFQDLSPLGFYGTDSGEHVAVCTYCSALVHYPPNPEAWPPEYVKGTQTLLHHLQTLHPGEARAR